MTQVRSYTVGDLPDEYQDEYQYDSYYQDVVNKIREKRKRSNSRTLTGQVEAQIQKLEAVLDKAEDTSWEYQRIQDAMNELSEQARANRERRERERSEPVHPLAGTFRGVPVTSDDGWLTNEWVRPGVVGGDTVPRNRYLSRSQVKHIDRARIQSQAQVDEALWLGTYHPRPKKLKFTHRLRRLLYPDDLWYRYLERLREKEEWKNDRRTT